MPVDPGVPVTVAKPKPVKRPAPAANAHGEPGRGTQGPAAFPPGPKPDLRHVEMPHPVLQAAGIDTGVQQFNEQVQEVVDAHKRAYGDTPSPGLTLDVIRARVPSEKLGDLFSVPKSPTQARAQQALRVQGVDRATAPKTPGEALTRGLEQLRSPDDLNTFMGEHGDEIAQAMGDPESRHEFESAYKQALARTSVGGTYASGHTAAPQELGLAPGSVAKEGFGLLGHAAEQIASGLVLGLPILGVAEAKAVGASVSQQSLDPLARTNVTLAKSVAKGAVEDVKHPKRNAGNLFLDIFGLASAGAGAVARGAAVGTALREGAGAAAVSRALFLKPVTGTYHLGPDADVPLSGNPLVAQVQKFVYSRRMKGLSLVENDGDVPTGVAASIGEDKAQQILGGIADPLRKNFSMQNKIGRQLRSADRVERAVRLAQVDPVVRATGAVRNTSLVLSRIGGKVRRGLNLGEEKAIQVLSTDDPTPLATWTSFHERMIEEGVGDPAAHRAQLAALEQAGKAIEHPSERLLAAIPAVRSLMDEQTALRIEKLGLAPEDAESRVARLGSVIRGQTDLAAASDEKLRARLGELDGRYNAFVDKLAQAEGKAGDYRATTAIQNAANAKSVARGRGPVYKTLSQQLRDQAEGKLLKVVAAHADDPVVQSFLRQTSEADAIRAELGARADKAVGLEEGASPAAEVPRNPDAHYLLYQSLAKTRRRPSTFFTPRTGPFGIAAPGSLPELSHYFTGDVIRAGDFRIDATRLATESYARTVALVMKVGAWKRLHDHYATDHPTGPDDVPIRDERAVHQELRTIINKADSGQILTAEDVEGLPSRMVDDLQKHLYPHAEDAVSADGKWKWVDPRYLASETRSSVPTPMVKAFSYLNEPLRDLTLFVRPAYALNMINSASMLGIDQGVFAIPNFVRALKAKEWYGPTAARQLDAMAGEGRMLSYAPDVGGVTRASHALAHAWNNVTDLYFRRAATIFYLRKLGYRTSDQIRQVLEDFSHNETAKKDVTEASQRAKKSLVELDNLVPFEKNVLRHVIFVYPWVSRSAVWSLRTIAEHPAQSAVYAEIAHEDKQELDPVLKHLPSWMRDSGYVPVGWNADGSPKMINAGGVNTWSTLGQIAGVAEGDQTFTDLLGPGSDLIVRLATERDRFGRAYAHPYVDPIVDTLTGLPQIATVKRAGQKEPAGKALDITNPDALAEQGRADVHRPIFFPGGFWNVYGPLILSGMDPRTVDPRAVAARWWQGQPWDARHTHELALVQKWTSAQGKFIGKNVPAAVREGNQVASEITGAYHAFSQQHGRSPTMPERTALEIDTLQGLGRINDRQAATLHATLKTVAPDELPTFRTGILDKFANGKDLSEWHRQVALVARITNRQNLDSDVQTLVQNKIVPSSFKDSANATGPVLQKYGRAYLAYDAKIREFAAKAKALRAEGKATGELDAQVRVWQDKQDHPVIVRASTKPAFSLSGKQAGLVAKGNIDINSRPVAFNPDGTISTVRTISIGVEGREVLIPTVVGGKVVSNARAIAHYKATGENLGSFSSVAAANGYSVALHKEQASEYHVLPPLPRLAIARLTPEQLAAHLKGNLTANWANLSALDKQLAGRVTSAAVTAEWAQLHATETEFHKDNPGVPLRRSQILDAAKQYDERDGLHGAFLADVQFAQLPSYARFEQLKGYTQSAHKPLWDWLFAAAKQMHKIYTTPGYDHGPKMQAQWDDVIDKQIVPEIQAHEPGFYREVETYLHNDPAFLRSLYK